MRKDRPIASAYLISMFVLYEASHALYICVYAIGLWTMINVNFYIASFNSICILAFLHPSITYSWNHFALIKHVSNKVSVNEHDSIKFQINGKKSYENKKF